MSGWRFRVGDLRCLTDRFKSPLGDPGIICDVCGVQSDDGVHVRDGDGSNFRFLVLCDAHRDEKGLLAGLERLAARGGVNALQIGYRERHRAAQVSS